MGVVDNYLRDAYEEGCSKWVECQVPCGTGNECVPGVLADVVVAVGCCISVSLDTGGGGFGRLLVEVPAGQVEDVCAALGKKFNVVGVF